MRQRDFVTQRQRESPAKRSTTRQSVLYYRIKPLQAPFRNSLSLASNPDMSLDLSVGQLDTQIRQHVLSKQRARVHVGRQEIHIRLGVLHVDRRQASHVGHLEQMLQVCAREPPRMRACELGQLVSWFRCRAESLTFNERFDLG